MSWTSLNDEKAFENILEGSYKIPLFIFKHSPRCGTSRYVLDHLKAGQFDRDQDVFQVDVVQDRSLSHLIAQKLAVLHESPQLLLIHQGECVWAEDHLEIDPMEAMAEYTRYVTPL